MRLTMRLRRKIGRLLGKDVKAALPPPQIADWNTKFDSVLGGKQTELIYWPGYSNPYQTLFYGAETGHFRAHAGTIEDALSALSSAKADQVCFHIHWLNGLFSGTDRAEAAQKISNFLERLRTFENAGGIIFWTVHNLHEHDITEGPAEIDARREIVRLSRAVFVHGPAARMSVEAILPEAADKLQIIPHGSYIGVYPDAIAPATARHRLNLPQDKTVFLNVGLVRKYKGVDVLCDAVRGLAGAALAVAGGLDAKTRDEIDALFTATPEARLYPGWVPDTELQLYLNAADFVVLPYQASLTSGAALLALSFGVPIIAPAIGAFPEAVTDGETGFLYTPSEPGALRAALTRALDTDTATHAKMRLAAYDAASRQTWGPGRLTLFQSLSKR